MEKKIKPRIDYNIVNIMEMRKEILDLSKDNEHLRKALKKVLQKFKEPFYSGEPKSYETIEEIALKALDGRRN